MRYYSRRLPSIYLEREKAHVSHESERRRGAPERQRTHFFLAKEARKELGDGKTHDVREGDWREKA